jgi:hypothetical protein
MPAFMKQLNVPLLSQLHRATPMDSVSPSLDDLNKHAIEIAPWAQFNYVPKVAFSIAHNKDCIFLKYYVEEAVVKAAYHQPNDDVYKDSCVEFFIAFEGEEAYYNLEFNTIGTCKFNFGKGRGDRILISESLIKKIRYLVTIQNIENAVQWELSLAIPLNVFSQHQITSLSGKTCNANFYKCGDELPVPHFLCWNNIETPEPDFHVRRCFGSVQFL